MWLLAKEGLFFQLTWEDVSFWTRLFYGPLLLCHVLRDIDTSVGGFFDLSVCCYEIETWPPYFLAFSFLLKIGKVSI